MSNLENAVILMNERWLNSLTEMEDYVPSRKQQRNIKRIDERLRGGKYHKLTRRAVAVLVAAALLLAALTVAVANETSRNYIIEKFSRYSVYRIEEPEKTEVKPIETGYIPEGFVQTEIDNNKDYSCIDYINGDMFFSLDKWDIDTEKYFDTEHHQKRIVKHNNIEYLCLKLYNLLNIFSDILPAKTGCFDQNGTGL